MVLIIDSAVYFFINGKFWNIKKNSTVWSNGWRKEVFNQLSYGELLNGKFSKAMTLFLVLFKELNLSVLWSISYGP